MKDIYIENYKILMKETNAKVSHKLFFIAV